MIGCLYKIIYIVFVLAALVIALHLGSTGNVIGWLVFATVVLLIVRYFVEPIR